jgi:hypothetical protein
MVAGRVRGRARATGSGLFQRKKASVTITNSGIRIPML